MNENSTEKSNSLKLERTIFKFQTLSSPHIVSAPLQAISSKYQIISVDVLYNTVKLSVDRKVGICRDRYIRPFKLAKIYSIILCIEKLFPILRNL